MNYRCVNAVCNEPFGAPPRGGCTECGGEQFRDVRNGCVLSVENEECESA